MMKNYLKENDVHIKDGNDVNSVMRDMMSVILEGTLDAEMDEELGYSKYDYTNKDTDNSRNGYSQKTMCHNGWVQRAISNKRLADFGLISMLDYYTARCVTC